MEIIKNAINKLKSSSWIKVDWRLSSDGDSTEFEITDAKLHVPIVTLSIKDNVNVTKQLSVGFKRFVKWNNYQTKPGRVIKKESLYQLLNAAFQGVRRLFLITSVVTVGAANNEAGIKNNRKYFLPRGEFENYNVYINGTNFYHQPINGINDKTVWWSHESINREWWWLNYRIFVTLCVFQR